MIYTYLTFQTYRLNYEAARIAKRAVDDVMKATGDKKYVAGAMGPTNRTLSISPSVEKPDFRNISKQEITIKINSTPPPPQEF